MKKQIGHACEQLGATCIISMHGHLPVRLLCRYMLDYYSPVQFPKTYTINLFKYGLLARYMHAHHMPHAENVENCRLDKKAKHGRDDLGSVPLLWSLPTATPCCPPTMPLMS